MNYKGRLNYGSAGHGSGGHLAAELYNMMTGVKAQHIPYKGAAPTLIDLAGGHFQFAFAGMLASQPFINQPDVRQRILSEGADTVGSTPEAFRKYLLADLAK